MGITTHISSLLQKAKRLGMVTPEALEALALARGLRYFGTPDRWPDVSTEDFSNEELALALMSPSIPYSLNRLRMAGALIGGNNISAEKVIRLARQERCEAIIRHIAACALKVEPQNLFWHKLLKALPESKAVPVDALPHYSRFTAMTGLSREGKIYKNQWIRPTSGEKSDS